MANCKQTLKQGQTIPESSTIRFAPEYLYTNKDKESGSSYVSLWEKKDTRSAKAIPSVLIHQDEMTDIARKCKQAKTDDKNLYSVLQPKFS